MTTKEFNKRAEKIVLNFGGTKDNTILENEFNINTVFGNLRIYPNPSPKIKSYAVFMRFTEPERYDHKRFEDLYCKYNKPSKFSLKWNIHNSDPEFVLDELEERINNLVWLMNTENQRLVELENNR